MCPWIGRAGALFFPLVLLLAVAACQERTRDDQPVVLPLASDTLRLAPGVHLIDIAVGGLDGGREFEPSGATAKVGDVVRFRAGDTRTHAVVFDAQSLSPEARAFLDSTLQLRGPPLLAPGSAWIVNFEGAPPGVYPFLCITHGAHGVLVVNAPE